MKQKLVIFLGQHNEGAGKNPRAVTQNKEDYRILLRKEGDEMANFHACRVVAIGDEAQMTTLLKRMILNVDKSYEKVLNQRKTIAELESQIHSMAKAVDDAYEFLMEMITPAPEGGFYSVDSHFYTKKHRNGLYTATFSYDDAWAFHENDFLELHKAAGRIHMEALHSDESPDRGRGTWVFLDGEKQDDYDDMDAAYILQQWSDFGLDEEDEEYDDFNEDLLNAINMSNLRDVLQELKRIKMIRLVTEAELLKMKMTDNGDYDQEVIQTVYKELMPVDGSVLERLETLINHVNAQSPEEVGLSKGVHVIVEEAILKGDTSHETPSGDGMITDFNEENGQKLGDTNHKKEFSVDHVIVMPDSYPASERMYKRVEIAKGKQVFIVEFNPENALKRIEKAYNNYTGAIYRPEDVAEKYLTPSDLADPAPLRELGKVSYQEANEEINAFFTICRLVTNEKILARLVEAADKTKAGLLHKKRVQLLCKMDITKGSSFYVLRAVNIDSTTIQLDLKTYDATYSGYSAAGYIDSAAKYIESVNDSSQKKVDACCPSNTINMRSDSTVVAVGENYVGQCNVMDWTGIVAIACGIAHTVGLRNDGMVVAVGNNECEECNVTDWTGIAAIACGGFHTVGLRNDGTVVAAGYYGMQRDVTDWTGIASIVCGFAHTVGLRKDGTVVAVGDNDQGQCDVADWTGIVAIACRSHTVGLREDGTVVATGNNIYGQCDVADWTDIVAVVCGDYYTVGLREDGTVVATGNNIYGQCDVADWTDIVAVVCGELRTVGLRKDGTVVAVGDNEEGQCDVADWTGIVAIDCGEFHIAGLKKDGTVVAVGDNEEGQCDVAGWTDIVAVACGNSHTVGLRKDGAMGAKGDNESGQYGISGRTDIESSAAGNSHAVGLIDLSTTPLFTPSVPFGKDVTTYQYVFLNDHQSAFEEAFPDNDDHNGYWGVVVEGELNDKTGQHTYIIHDADLKQKIDDYDLINASDLQALKEAYLKPVYERIVEANGDLSVYNNFYVHEINGPQRFERFCEFIDRDYGIDFSSLKSQIKVHRMLQFGNFLKAERSANIQRLETSRCEYYSIEIPEFNKLVGSDYRIEIQDGAISAIHEMVVQHNYEDQKALFDELVNLKLESSRLDDLNWYCKAIAGSVNPQIYGHYHDYYKDNFYSSTPFLKDISIINQNYKDSTELQDTSGFFQLIFAHPNVLEALELDEDDREWANDTFDSNLEVQSALEGIASRIAKQVVTDRLLDDPNLTSEQRYMYRNAIAHKLNLEQDDGTFAKRKFDQSIFSTANFDRRYRSVQVGPFNAPIPDMYLYTTKPEDLDGREIIVMLPEAGIDEVNSETFATYSYHSYHIRKLANDHDAAVVWENRYAFMDGMGEQFYDGETLVDNDKTLLSLYSTHNYEGDEENIIYNGIVLDPKSGIYIVQSQYNFNDNIDQLRNHTIMLLKLMVTPTTQWSQITGTELNATVSKAPAPDRAIPGSELCEGHNYISTVASTLAGLQSMAKGQIEININKGGVDIELSRIEFDEDAGIHFFPAKTAWDFADVFHVHPDVFRSSNDREVEISQQYIKSYAQVHLLRSFAWSLASYLQKTGKSLSQVSTADISVVVAYIEKYKGLNYKADSLFPALCSAKDNGAAYLSISEKDPRWAKLRKRIGIDRLFKISDLVTELKSLLPAMQIIHDQLANQKDPRTGAPDNTLANILYTYCSLGIAAQGSLVFTEGTMSYFFPQPERPVGKYGFEYNHSGLSLEDFCEDNDLNEDHDDSEEDNSFDKEYENKGGSEITAIAAGNSHTVGLRSDGTVVAVGDNDDGQCEVSGWTDIAAIAAGMWHTVGLKSVGTVVSVGDNDDRRGEVSDWTDIVAIACGSFHTVGLRGDNTVVAVGKNEDGQCDVSDWTGIATITCGSYHTVGLKRDGTVVAVGDNTIGQCDVSNWTDIAAIACGATHTVGLRSDGTVVVVGRNNEGQCDVSDWADIAAISGGDYHTVGLKSDGTVVAAGRNNDGQCDVSDWADITAISSGDYHTVGLKRDGTVVAVGNNDKRQCEVSDGTDISAIDCGETHTVGLKRDGTVVAVGNNDYGQCEVSDWTDIVAIASVIAHTVGLRNDGTVVAVGGNGYGQCEVSGWTDIATIACGSFHTVGLRSDDTVVAVGMNRSGQCEVTDWTDIVAISGGDYHTVGLKRDGTVVAAGDTICGADEVTDWTGIAAIACGLYHTVGLKRDGTVVSVGDNDDGRCGVSNWTDIVAIACGSYHTIGLKSDGTVIAVGRNNEGQCDVSHWTGIAVIAGGDTHSVGLKGNGTVVAVGNNIDGQCKVAGFNKF